MQKVTEHQQLLSGSRGAEMPAEAAAGSCHTRVLGTCMGRNLEERNAPCLCVENSHSFLKESTCVEFIYALIYTAKKIKDVAVKQQRSGSMLSHS